MLQTGDVQPADLYQPLVIFLKGCPVPRRSRLRLANAADVCSADATAASICLTCGAFSGAPNRGRAGCPENRPTDLVFRVGLEFDRWPGSKLSIAEIRPITPVETRSSRQMLSGRRSCIRRAISLTCAVFQNEPLSFLFVNHDRYRIAIHKISTVIQLSFRSRQLPVLSGHNQTDQPCLRGGFRSSGFAGPS